MAKARLEKAREKLSAEEIRRKREEVARNVLMTSQAQDFNEREDEDIEIREEQLKTPRRPHNRSEHFREVTKPSHLRQDVARGALPQEQAGSSQRWSVPDEFPRDEFTSLTHLNETLTQDLGTNAERRSPGLPIPQEPEAWGILPDSEVTRIRSKYPWYFRYFKETGLSDEEIIKEVTSMLEEKEPSVGGSYRAMDAPIGRATSIREVKDALQGIADSKGKK